MLSVRLEGVSVSAEYSTGTLQCLASVKLEKTIRVQCRSETNIKVKLEVWTRDR
jgi:hypothetical protein